MILVFIIADTNNQYLTAETSKDLYHAYTFWCDSNALTPLCMKSFTNWIHNNEDKLGIRYSKHILQNNGIEIRGFKGLKVV